MQPSRLLGPRVMLAQHCTAPSEVLRCSAPAGADSCAVQLACSRLHLPAFPRCCPLGYRALLLVMEAFWAESRRCWCALELPVTACVDETQRAQAKGHRSIMELHPPGSTPPPGTLHRPVYHCALPSEAGLPSLQHPPDPFSLAATHTFTLHPFSSCSPWMALVETAEISHVCFVSPVRQVEIAYRRSTHAKYSFPVPSPFPSPAYSSARQA